MISSNFQNIRNLIAHNKIDEAFKELEQQIPDNLRDDLIVLKSSYNSFEKDRRLGMNSPSEDSVRRNRITANLLDLVSISEVESEEKGSRHSKTAHEKGFYETAVLPATLPFYFLSIALENIWSFRNRQTLDLSDGNHKPARWSIILGDNGTGKTTLLKCLVELGNFFQAAPEKILIKGENEIKINPRPVFLHEESQSTAGIDCEYFFAGNLDDKKSPGLFEGYSLKLAPSGYGRSRLFPKKFLHEQHIFAYGASRRMGRGSLTETKNPDPTASLFDQTATLVNAAAWLLETDFAIKSTSGDAQKKLEHRYKNITSMLKRVLPDVEDFKVGVEEGGTQATVLVKTPYAWVELKNLSLGYQTISAWIVDLAVRMYDRYPDSHDPLAEPAIVMVDEIDLHLHPQWQRRIIAELSQIFPQTQFIVTAHSPLIVQAADEANLILLKREGNSVTIYNRKDEDVIQGWRIDQILTSDLFGLQSARPPKYEVMLDRQQKLASKPTLTENDKKELRDIGENLSVIEPVPENKDQADIWESLKKANEILQTYRQS